MFRGCSFFHNQKSPVAKHKPKLRSEVHRWSEWFLLFLEKAWYSLQLFWCSPLATLRPTPTCKIYIWVGTTYLCLYTVDKCVNAIKLYLKCKAISLSYENLLYSLSYHSSNGQYKHELLLINITDGKSC